MTTGPKSTGAHTAPAPASSLRLGLAVNLGTTIWNAAVVIASVPLYVRLLGMEAYGVIGLFTTLQASLAILDLGLSSTMTRELARLRATNAAASETADLVRTLEWLYGGVAVLVGILLRALAEPLSLYWVTPEHIDRTTLTHAFMQMALATAVQWPASLYAGAMLGFEKQISYAMVNAVFTTTKAIGVLAFLYATGPTVQAFLVWQTINSAVQIAVLAGLVWRELPGSFLRARFRVGQLRQVWRFAAGNVAINASGLILSQIDRVVLSRFLSLENFGLYSLVSTVASNLGRLVGPVFALYYPRLASLAASGDDAELRRVYRDGAQVLALLVAPVCVILIVFSREILIVWTEDTAIANEGATILSLLVLGRLINAAMHLPAALQLAHGWTSLSFYSNVLAVLLVVPTVIVGVGLWGPLGAALAWVAMNGAVMAVQVPLMHRRLLAGEGGPWFRDAVALPLVAAVVPALLARILFVEASRWYLLAELMPIGLASLLGCALATTVSRRWLLARWSHA